MPRIRAFHTKDAPWSQAGVYHDNDQCLNGLAIPKESRLEGMGVYDPCLECGWWHSREAEVTLSLMPPQLPDIGVTDAAV
jgi:hypothetical protein